MRHDDSSSERVNRLLDQGRQRPKPADPEEDWPQVWPDAGPEDDPFALGPAGSGGGLSGQGAPGGGGPGGYGFGPRSGPRWQVPVPAAIAAGVLALVVVAIAAVLLLQGSAPGAQVLPRAPAVVDELPTGPAEGSSPTVTGPVGVPASGGAGLASPAGAGGSAAAGLLRVYVVGQVRRPGVVSLAAGSRVEDAVQAVGGATAKADLASMNLARKVVDGERIVVPKPGEKLPAAEPVPNPGASSGAGTGGAEPGAPVDLNTATVAQLDSLPGVGPVIAGRIVAWREENGRFTRVDDLAEVQGIGEATLARLRPLVRV